MSDVITDASSYRYPHCPLLLLLLLQHRAAELAYFYLSLAIAPPIGLMHEHTYPPTPITYLRAGWLPEFKDTPIAFIADLLRYKHCDCGATTTNTNPLAHSLTHSLNTHQLSSGAS
eukprot:GHVU01182404.1.p1 GENE.GHVU01182404.1~~GHVU01182404.1.p1  ORF type:complete len:116 (+),score=16.09 GHVU01182404.1:161-508(+)